MHTSPTVGRRVVNVLTQVALARNGHAQGTVAKHLDAHQIAVRPSNLLTFNLFGDVTHLVDVQLSCGDHHISELGIILHRLEVGDVALSGHVHFDTDLSCILDDALVGGNDGRDAVGFDGVQQLVHLLHFLVINHRIDCDIALYAVLVAGFGQLTQVVQSEVFRRARAHIEFADTEINASGTGLYGGCQGFVRAHWSHDFDVLFHGCKSTKKITAPMSANVLRF